MGTCHRREARSHIGLRSQLPPFTPHGKFLKSWEQALPGPAACPGRVFLHRSGSASGSPQGSL